MDLGLLVAINLFNGRLEMRRNRFLDGLDSFGSMQMRTKGIGFNW